MKKFTEIIREYPAAALLCAFGDFAITYHFTTYLMADEPVSIVYFITLYGTVFGMFILGIGWKCACERFEIKQAERQRLKRRSAIASMYSREFYSITDKI